MFSSLPNIEKFELRVEVEWGKQLHPVAVLLKKLPGAGAVLVCTPTDSLDYGEWMVIRTDSIEPVVITNLNNLPKLRRFVGNAFSKHRLNIARLIGLDELAAPQIVLLTSPSNGFWRFDWNPIEWRERSQRVAPFVLDEPLLPTESGARELLLRAWKDETSDARFAWNWLQLSRNDQMARLSGYNGEWSELRRVMRLILLCSIQIWNRGESWGWSLHPQFAARGHLVNASNRRDNAPNARFAAWQEWLFARFVPDFGEAMLEQHVCAREFWRQAESLESVRIEAPPTSHEQLEARLGLPRMARR